MIDHEQFSSTAGIKAASPASFLNLFILFSYPHLHGSLKSYKPNLFKNANNLKVHLINRHYKKYRVQNPDDNDVLGTMTRDSPTHPIKCFHKDCNLTHHDIRGFIKHWPVHGYAKVQVVTEDFPKVSATKDAIQAKPKYQYVAECPPLPLGTASDSMDGGYPQSLSTPESNPVHDTSVSLDGGYPQSTITVKPPTPPILSNVNNQSTGLLMLHPASTTRSLDVDNGLPYPIVGDDSLMAVEYAPKPNHLSPDRHSLDPLVLRGHPYKRPTQQSPVNPVSVQTQNPEPSPPDSATPTLEKHQLDLLRRNGWGLDMFRRLVICMPCGTAFQPGSHRHRHDMEFETFQTLTSLLKTLPLHTSNETVDCPPCQSAPIPLIKVIPAYACNHCSYVSRVEKTLDNHTGPNHPETKGTVRHHACFAQTIFHYRPRYFEVKKDSGVSSSNGSSFMDAFTREVAPNLDSLKPVPQPEGNEVSQLLRNTHWHAHLAPFTKTSSDVKYLRSLMYPSEEKKPAWFKALDSNVKKYLTDIRAEAINSSFMVRCCLNEYPVTSQTPTAWSLLLNDSTLNHYGNLLRHFILTILLCANNEPPAYTLPLTQQQRSTAETLRKSLATCPEPSTEALTLIHELAKMMFYPLPPPVPGVAHSKWDQVLERLVALAALKEDGSFKAAHEVTQMFAILQYLIRGTVFYEALNQYRSNGTTLLSCVQNEAAVAIVAGIDSPFNAVISYQRVASQLAYASTLPPTTVVSEDGYTVTYCGKLFNVHSWRAGLSKLYTNTSTLINELLRHQTYGLSIPEHVEDDWTSTLRGYSWVNNHPFVQTSRPLLRAMLSDPNCQLAKFDAEGHLVWNHGLVISLLNTITTVVKNLALLTLYTSGQPARISEFIDHKFANSDKPRTIFRHGTDLWFVTRRLKTENIQRRESFVPIKCPPKVTSLWDLYLLLIKPFEIDLVYIAHGEEAALLHKEFVWVSHGQRMQVEKFRELFPQFMSEYCGCDVNVKAYRQIAVQLSRVFLGLHEEYDPEDVDDIYAAQRGHSHSMAVARYGIEAGRLSMLSSDDLLRFGRASESWWTVCDVHPSAPACLPVHTRNQILSSVAGSSVENPQSSVDTAHLLINLKSLFVAEFQRVQHTLKDEILSSMTSALTVSAANVNSHSTTTGKALQGIQSFKPFSPPSHPFSNHLDLAHYTQEPHLRERDLKLLRTFFASTEVTFKSKHQALAVELSISNCYSFVAVLPTGSGKSLTYLLPAVADRDQGVFTIVVVPNKSLLRSQEENARKSGLNTTIWRAHVEGILPPDIQLVFMAVESITALTFKSFWATHSSRIARLVVDEAHQILSAQDYRTSFNKIRDLALLAVPKVFLTASLPRQWEKDFLSDTNMLPTTTFVRASSNQLHISYSVFHYDSNTTSRSKLLSRLIPHIATNVLADNQQGIIFVTSHGDAKKFGTILECPYTYSEMPMIERDLNEDKWIQGKARWIVATNVLIHGIDLSTIGAVVFLGNPYGLLNIYQGAGRGGRDGRRSWAFMLNDNKTLQIKPRKGDTDVECIRESEELIKEYKCRRVVLSRTLDGEVKTCADLKDCHACDFCSPDLPLWSDMNQIIESSNRVPPPPVVHHLPVQQANVASDFPQQQPPADEFDAIHAAYDETLDLAGLSSDDIQFSLPATRRSRPGTSIAQTSSPNPSSQPSNPPSSTPFSSTSNALYPTPNSSFGPRGVKRTVHTMMEQQHAENIRRQKYDKMEVLRAFDQFIKGKCVVCWLAGAGFRAKDHSCNACSGQEPVIRPFRNPLKACWDFKKAMQLTKYQYCFYCGLPQKEYILDGHEVFKKGVSMLKCSFEDLHAHLLFHIRGAPFIWLQAQDAFPTLKMAILQAGGERKFTWMAFAQWCELEEDRSVAFYNGLELIIWGLPIIQARIEQYSFSKPEN
ncbi:hypothetical protein CVT24_008784 [Panaeolus cyanescens]|uniref:DNA 3'-5' helicase n=1 Tax=Panaeolus cyanescens TaxID=181874 RepID=A0A409YX54_9AGAR|nr:hypothetical protein CVT24_008784 [Panaeolus cyanescens]